MVDLTKSPTTRIKVPTPPSMEEIRAEDRNRLAGYKAYLDAHPGTFIGVSLQDWLEAVKAAGVPYVPARKALTVNRQDFLSFDEGRPESQALWAQMCNLRGEVPTGHMIRWDPCATLGVKMAMQEGAPAEDEIVAESFDLHPEGDPRAYDIIYEYPAAEVPILSRPWVRAQMIEGFPVEYRVFIQNSEVIGVANYYPQRALPDTPEIRQHVFKCTAYTEEIIRFMAEREARPWMPNYDRAGFDMSGTLIHGTIDYLVRHDGEVLFLEAGPPFGAGAHPCAFEDKVRAGEAIEGVALNATARH